MAPSNKKRDLKNRTQDYNAKFYIIDQKFKKLKLNFKEDQESELTFSASK